MRAVKVAQAQVNDARGVPGRCTEQRTVRSGLS